MKTYIIPLILLLLVSCKSITPTADKVLRENTTIPKYQKLKNFKGKTNDTLAYVRKSIIDRKSEYIGKELNVLLNDLELPIKTYKFGGSHIKGISPSLSLEFYKKNIIELKKQAKTDPVILVIVWETPLPKDEVLPILSRSKGIWTKEAQNYYCKQKVKDIVLVDYKFQ